MGRRRRALIAAAALFCLAASTASAQERLRVCADPNNLPFSNRAGEGFENRIIQLVAEAMGREVEYVWWAQRRGYVRNTLNAGLCDVIPGIAANLEMVLATRPYYRSSYVFLYRSDRDFVLSSLDDPALRRLRLGVQMVGDDFSNTPPAHALARRGIVENVRGYMIYGDYAEPAPAARIVEAVAGGEIDAALVWGPVAGYFAARTDAPLTMRLVEPQLDPPGLPMAFDISMGVRRDSPELRRDLNQALIAQNAAIQAVLREYGAPTVDLLP